MAALTAANDPDTKFPPDQVSDPLVIHIQEISLIKDLQNQGESELLAALVPLAQWVGLDNPGQQVTDVFYGEIKLIVSTVK